jgi:hypothetical protein
MFNKNLIKKLGFSMYFNNILFIIKNYLHINNNYNIKIIHN